MRILSRKTLVAFWKKHPDAEQPLRAWFGEVEKASFTNTAQVRRRYASADFIAGNRIVFNIGGNKYRLIVAVKYAPYFLVFVRFLGTHAEYDSIDATKV